MFNFEKRDEGWLVTNADGRGVCDITAAAIEFDDNPKLKVPERMRVDIPKDKWKVHFCSIKLTPPELESLVAEIQALGK